MNKLIFNDNHEEQIISYYTSNDCADNENMVFWCKTCCGSIYRLVTYAYSDPKMGYACKSSQWQKFNDEHKEYFNTDEVERAIVYSTEENK